MISIKATNTILYCKHWDKAVDFYTRQLDLPINISKDWFIEFKLAEHAYLSIADESRASVKSSNGQGITITFEVEDIETSHLFLEKNGCKPSVIKNHAWGAKVVHVYDPEGNRLEYWCHNKNGNKP